VILKAAFALPMTKDEVAFFRTIAGDRDPPRRRVNSHGLALDRLNNSFTAFEISWLS
jgi:hypothetical protein